MKFLQRHPAARLALGYALLAALWILLSDRLLAALVRDPDWLSRLQTVKGWAFVAVTALLLYVAIHRELLARQQVEAALLVRDSSDRKRAEEALRQSEERFSKAFRASPIAISISTLAEGRLLDVNDGFLRLVGYRRPEVIGRTSVDLERSAWADPADRTRMLEALREKRSVHEMEAAFRTKSGEIRNGLLSAELIDLGGERCLLLLIHDITERKRAEEEIRRQTVRSQALVRVAARLNAQLDLEAVVGTVCEQTAQALKVPRATVYLYDEKRDALHYAGGFGVPPEFHAHVRPVPRALYDEYARQSGPVITIPDVRAVPGLPDSDLYAAFDIRSVAVGSMVREAQLVGTLNIVTYGEVRHFTENELALLKGLADQAAVAIVNARQHERLQRRLQESEAMAAISRALNETLDLERILQMIVDAARQIIPKVERAVIHLLDEDKQALRPAAVAGLDELGQPDFSMRSGEGVAGQVIAEGIVINVGDTQTDPRYLPLGRATHLLSLLVAPVQSGVHRLGTISVQSAAPYAFSSEDERLLATLGLQAALAIENARLFEATRRQLEELTVLHAVATAGAEAMSVDALIERATQILGDTLYPDNFGVLLLDEAAGVLRVPPSYRLSHASRMALNTLPLGQGIAGTVALTGRPWRVPDVSCEPEHLRVDPRTRSELCLPIKIGEQIMGVINAESARLDAFSESDERLLTTFAGQLATAIEKVRLWEAERRRAAEAEALQQVTQILISRLELPELLQSVTEAIATIANYKFVSLFLLERDRLVLQAHKGYTAPVRRVLQLDQGVSGQVARTRHPILVPDVARNGDYLEAIPGIQSTIGVPLIHGDQGLGVLLVESDAGQPLDDGDLNWLTNVGRQLSVAIENARLYAYLEKSLLQEKAARAHLVQTEKLAAMGRLVASVAHELNNPLQAIQNALYLVKQEGALSPQAREDLHVALTEADRMADLISRLRETYRPAAAEQFQPVLLNALVEEVQKLIATHLRHNNVTFEFDPDFNAPPVPGVRDQLKQVILNLGLNAVEAMPSGGRLTICTRHLPETGEVLLTVADTGIGIDLTTLPNIFDPFFTTKEGGTGLGLAITYDIVQHHDSRIDVESELGQGTTFRIWLRVDKTRFTVHNPQPVPEG